MQTSRNINNGLFYIQPIDHTMTTETQELCCSRLEQFINTQLPNELHCRLLIRRRPTNDMVFNVPNTNFTLIEIDHFILQIAFQPRISQQQPDFNNNVIPRGHSPDHSESEFSWSTEKF